MLILLKGNTINYHCFAVITQSHIIAGELVSNTHTLCAILNCVFLLIAVTLVGPNVATWRKVSLDIYAAFDCIILSWSLWQIIVAYFHFSFCVVSQIIHQEQAKGTALESTLHSHLLMQSKSIGLVSTLWLNWMYTCIESLTESFLQCKWNFYSVRPRLLTGSLPATDWLPPGAISSPNWFDEEVH